MREFRPSPHAIQAEAAINIAAPPTHVAALYRDVERWGQIFPATIAHARIVSAADNWKQIEVAHRVEGRVPNTLIFLGDTKIGLEESKKRFDASFLNRFEPAANGGTHFVINAYISLKGIYKVLRPFLKGYVRRKALEQVRRYVLEPLKRAAEADSGRVTPE